MSRLILSQLFNTLVMFYGGMLLVVFRDLLLLYQQRRRPGRALSFLQELCYWAFAGFLVPAFFYYCSYGKLSVHGFLALGAGALFWRWLWTDKFPQTQWRFCDILNNWIKDAKGEGVHGRETEHREASQGQGSR